MRPAQSLAGLTIDGKWKVLEAVKRPPGASGGTFSTGYIVQDMSGRRGFLKAIDFADALAHQDPARKLAEIASAFLFERDVCDACTKKSFDKVVVAWTHGRLQVNPADPYSVVQYIVFELADGDIRRHLDKVTTLDSAWQLRALHHITVGIRQLHSVDVAHQDIKPSNVLVFGSDTSKIADLGRASSKHLTSPFDILDIAGDLSYAPPELLYRYYPSDWNRRRFGCDLYLLGSMIFFMFSRITATGSIFAHLPPELHPGTYQGTYAAAIPYLRHGLECSIGMLKKDVPAFARDELITAARQLCEPDPALRGHPLHRVGVQNPHSLERYVALFDLLADKAQIASARS